MTREEINKLAGRQFDYAVAREVLGWICKGDGDYGRIYPPGNILCTRFYCNDPIDDLKVHRVAIKWIDSNQDRYNKYYKNLAEILRSRDPYYKPTVNQFELYYMDQYQPGDFSRAALLATATD